MNGADQPGFVRVVVDRGQFDIDFFTFEYHRRATGYELADPACAEAAADRDAFRIFPFLQLEKTLNDQGKFLREILDCRVHKARRFRFSAQQQLIKLGFGEIIAVFVPKRIFAGFAQQLADVVDHVAKSTSADAIADEPFAILEFNVVAVDIDGRKATCAVSCHRG
ncbi:MAG: hypothetical protein WCD67_13295 [Xanthobacteraceae bacterium]